VEADLRDERLDPVDQVWDEAARRRLQGSPHERIKVLVGHLRRIPWRYTIVVVVVANAAVAHDTHVVPAFTLLKLPPWSIG
jgi:hypothetical protein